MTSFISHSHSDKDIARRVARRLMAHGVPVWLDERELRLGDALDSSLMEHIEACGSVIVIATDRAAASRWVDLELQFATSQQPAKSIIPLFVEPLQKHELFQNYVGLDATDIHFFERTVLQLARYLAGKDLPPPSNAVLHEALDRIRLEAPPLALLIDDCLDGPGLAVQHAESVIADAPFHSLDFTLNALSDIAVGAQRYAVAHAAAFAFVRTGAGTYAIEQDLLERRSDAVLRSVATRLDIAHFDAALHLLSIGERDDQSIAQFIDRNCATLEPQQKTTVARLLSRPKRGPKGFAADAAFYALRCMPDNEDMQRLWQWWIMDGLFDGLSQESAAPDVLAFWLGEAVKSSRPGWQNVLQAYRDHLRSLARSKDKARVYAAVDHVVAAAKREAPFLHEAARIVASAPGSAEWDDWPDAADMGHYVRTFVAEAQGEQDWLRAWARYDEMTAARRAHDKALRELRPHTSPASHTEQNGDADEDSKL